MADVTSFATLNEIPVLEPDELRASYPELRNVPANSYTCPVGPQHGRAFVLMRRGDIDEIIESATFTLKFTANWAADSHKDEAAELPGLYWLQATRLNIGTEDDVNAPYLVELVDKRWLLERWSDTGAIVSNWRTYAVGDDDYLDGTDKTWDQLIEAIWDTMSDLLGAYSDSIVDDLVPEKWDIRGQNAWQALHAVLGSIRRTTAYDPLTGAVSIVELTAQGQTIPDSYVDDIDRNAEIITHPSTEQPENVTVHFHSHFKNYGQERDIEHANNWQAEADVASVTETVATNLTGAVVGTKLPLWADTPAVFDIDNAIDNATDISDRAINLAAGWTTNAAYATNQRVYIGYKTDVLPSESIKAIQWRSVGRGPETVIAEGASVLGARMEDGSLGLLSGKPPEEMQSPDLSRRTFPNFPRLPNAVIVDDESSDTGDLIEPNGSGFHPGFVRRFVAQAMATLEECWILHLDLDTDDTPTEGAPMPLRQKDQFIGRLSGMADHSGDVRPLYLVRSGGGSGISMLAECITALDWSPVAAVPEVRSITVNRHASLLLGQHTDPTRALIDIGGGPDNSVFWQGAIGGAAPQWHQSPILNTSLTIGVGSNDGYLQLGGSSGTRLMAGDGLQMLNIRFPAAAPPGINSHLYVSALGGSGTCAATSWGAQGITAAFYTYSPLCDGTYCRYIQVERGIIFAITDEEPPAAGDQGSPDCTAVPASPFDPCV